MAEWLGAANPRISFRMGKKLFIGLGVLIVLLVIVVLAMPKGSSFENLGNYEGDIKIYKEGSCGCCGVYTGYFQSKGNSNVESVNLEDTAGIKTQYGVPSQLESCHTTVIGNYFVEGHIPLEAVERLLQEQPDIKGIAMPGMPSGSPGMPGGKNGDFVIYAVNDDGSYEEWMRT